MPECQAYFRGVVRLLCFSFVLTAALAGLFSVKVSGQARLSDPNALAWFNGFGTFYLSPKTALYTEYQWRREGLFENWQQSLARVGVQRNLGTRTTAILGYGHIITFPYGEYPAGPHPVVEHRVWQQLSWDDASAGEALRVKPAVLLNHRFRFEQRFIQKVPQREAARRVDGYTYTSRLRYQLRATRPFNLTRRSKVANRDDVMSQPPEIIFYLAAYDEIFIGFGPDVGQNIFDQNRLGLLLGYNASKAFRIEGGYFSQFVQQGAEVQDKEVFQYNHGFILNAYYTLPAKPRR